MVYVKHMQSLNQWKRLAFSDRRILYSHRRDIKKVPRCVIMSNQKMPIRVFDNKCRFHELMRGSSYYPPDPEVGDLVIVKKPLSSEGEGHYITRMTSRLPRNVCIQPLVEDPLLIDGCKCSMRILVGFTVDCFIMPYENALILVCNVPYVRSELSSEITNTSYNVSRVRDFSKLKEALVRNGCLDAFVRNMKGLSADLQARFSPHCRSHSFDVHGIDVLVKKDGTPIVIETNPYWYSGSCTGGFEDKLEMFRRIVSTLSTRLERVGPRPERVTAALDDTRPGVPHL